MVRTNLKNRKTDSIKRLIFKEPHILKNTASKKKELFLLSDAINLLKSS